MTTTEYRSLGLKLGDIVTINLYNGPSISSVYVDSDDYYELDAKYEYAPESKFPPRLVRPAMPPCILYTSLRVHNNSVSQKAFLTDISSIDIISKAPRRP